MRSSGLFPPIQLIKESDMKAMRIASSGILAGRLFEEKKKS
jgi:hypothetical protein